MLPMAMAQNRQPLATAGRTPRGPSRIRPVFHDVRARVGVAVAPVVGLDARPRQDGQPGGAPFLERDALRRGQEGGAEAAVLPRAGSGVVVAEGAREES